MKDCDSTGATSAAGMPQITEADVGRKLLVSFAVHVQVFWDLCV